MAKFAHDYGRVSINGSTAAANADGTVTTVLTSGPATGHPNALTTLEHHHGMIAYRWFLAESVPDRPDAQVVPVGDAPTTLS